MKKGPVVQGVALAKGSKVGQKPQYHSFANKAAKPYANQARAKAAGRMKG